MNIELQIKKLQIGIKMNIELQIKKLQIGIKMNVELQIKKLQIGIKMNIELQIKNVRKMSMDGVLKDFLQTTSSRYYYYLYLFVYLFIYFAGLHVEFHRAGSNGTFLKIFYLRGGDDFRDLGSRGEIKN